MSLNEEEYSRRLGVISDAEGVVELRAAVMNALKLWRSLRGTEWRVGSGSPAADHTGAAAFWGLAGHSGARPRAACCKRSI